MTDDLDFIAEHLSNRSFAHSRLDKWRSDLAERVWRQRTLLKRRGFFGEDWEPLLEELEEFAFIEQHMAAEIARRHTKEAA